MLAEKVKVAEDHFILAVQKCDNPAIRSHWYEENVRLLLELLHHVRRILTVAYYTKSNCIDFILKMIEKSSIFGIDKKT